MHPLISGRRWNNWHLAVFHDFIWGDGVISFTSFSLLLPKCLTQWCITERKAHKPLTCLLTYEVIFPLSTEFAHYSLFYIISTMGVIVFSPPSHSWAWALLSPLAVLVQNKRHMLWLGFSRGPWDSSDYKCLLVMAPTGRGVPGIWKQSGVIWAIKDMMHYAVAVKFFQQCQESDAVLCSGARAQRAGGHSWWCSAWISKLAPSVGLSWFVRGFENTTYP